MFPRTLSRRAPPLWAAGVVPNGLSPHSRGVSGCRMGPFFFRGVSSKDATLGVWPVALSSYLRPTAFEHRRVGTTVKSSDASSFQVIAWCDTLLTGRFVSCSYRSQCKRWSHARGGTASGGLHSADSAYGT